MTKLPTILIDDARTVACRSCYCDNPEDGEHDNACDAVTEEIEARDAQHEAEKAELREKLAALTEEYACNNKQRSELIDELATLEAKLAEVERERDEAIRSAVAYHDTRQSVQADSDALRAELESTKPEWDATDGAHPCWWRGHDAGAKGMADLVAKLRAEVSRLTDELRESEDDRLAMFDHSADVQQLRGENVALRAEVERFKAVLKMCDEINCIQPACNRVRNAARALNPEPSK